MFGADFARKWECADKSVMKQVWAHGLNGYMISEIEFGLESIGKYPPSLAEFKLLCRPALDLERAYLEAVEQMQLRKDGRDKWSSPVIYWAAASMGNDLQNHPYQSLEKRWAKAVSETRDKIRKGLLPDQVPRRLEALPMPGKATSREEARKNIAKINQMISENFSITGTEA